MTSLMCHAACALVLLAPPTSAHTNQPDPEAATEPSHPSLRGQYQRLMPALRTDWPRDQEHPALDTWQALLPIEWIDPRLARAAADFGPIAWLYDVGNARISNSHIRAEELWTFVIENTPAVLESEVGRHSAEDAAIGELLERGWMRLEGGSFLYRARQLHHGWLTPVLSVAAELAGPDHPVPLEFEIQSGARTRHALGLFARNTSGRLLTGVTLVVTSNLAGGDTPSAYHWLYLDEWHPGHEIPFPATLLLEVRNGAPPPAREPAIAYSIWSDQLRWEGQFLNSPRAQQRVTFQGPGERPRPDAGEMPVTRFPLINGGRIDPQVDSAPDTSAPLADRPASRSPDSPSVAGDPPSEQASQPAEADPHPQALAAVPAPQVTRSAAGLPAAFRCTRCAGAGQLDRSSPAQRRTGPPPSRVERCGMCDGTGYAPAIRFTRPMDRFVVDLASADRGHERYTASLQIWRGHLEEVLSIRRGSPPQTLNDAAVARLNSASLRVGDPVWLVGLPQNALRLADGSTVRAITVVQPGGPRITVALTDLHIDSTSGSREALAGGTFTGTVTTAAGQSIPRLSSGFVVTPSRTP